MVFMLYMLYYVHIHLYYTGAKDTLHLAVVVMATWLLRVGISFPLVHALTHW